MVRKLCNERTLTLKFTEFEYKMLEAYFYFVDPRFPWDICENNFPVLFLNHYPIFSKNCGTSLSGETRLLWVHSSHRVLCCFWTTCSQGCSGLLSSMLWGRRIVVIHCASDQVGQSNISFAESIITAHSSHAL